MLNSNLNYFCINKYYNRYTLMSVKKQLNCWTPKATYEHIEARAKKLGIRASAYGSLILNNWAKSGKGITEIEAELEKLKAPKGS